MATDLEYAILSRECYERNGGNPGPNWVGDGNDRIIDSDKQGRILVVGNNEKILLDTSDFFQDRTNPTIWKNADESLTLTHNSPWKIVTSDGGEILLGDDFADGDYGIRRQNAPTSINPANTIMGTKEGNALSGTSAGDLIDGQDGKDIISGADGNDKMYGTGRASPAYYLCHIDLA
jgi:Ca2+-binding RTX toxin-like protein